MTEQSYRQRQTEGHKMEMRRDGGTYRNIQRLKKKNLKAGEERIQQEQRVSRAQR